MENGFRPAVFFSNSNIYPREEYNLRLSEIRRYAEKMGLEIIDDVYDHAAWLDDVKGHETDPERGPRCLKCFEFRLKRAAEYAAANGFNVLTTTLASSRWKSLEQVDEAGMKACGQVQGVRWWGMNWRKGGLQERRGEIIKEQQFYNQNYCGCEFSKNTYICSR